MLYKLSRLDVLRVVLNHYKERLEKLPQRKEFEEIFVQSASEVIDNDIKILNDLIKYTESEAQSEEIEERSDLLYPYLCRSIKCYIHDLNQTKEMSQKSLGEGCIEFDKVNRDLERLEKLQEIFCK